MSEAERFAVITFIARNPHAGAIIAGTGGARKARIAGRSKGKSGGYRVITFFTGAGFPVFLLSVFAKNEKTSLTQSECGDLKKVLNAITKSYANRKVPK